MNISMSSQQLEPGGSRQSDVIAKWRINTLFVVTLLLMVMYLYLAVTSAWDYSSAKYKMSQQVFPSFIAGHLTWINILLQAFAGFFLFVGLWNERFIRRALFFALVPLSIYTLYTLLVIFDLFKSSACTCIAMFAGMSWGQSLMLNGVLLAIAVLAYVFTPKPVKH